MTLEDSQGQFLFQPMLSGDVPSNILGFPFTEMQDLTDGTAGAGDVPVVFGDYNRAYYVLDRLAMEVIRDPYSAKKQGKIEYHFRGRVGGDLVLGEAVNGVSIP
jgi:HK97 family phage major capsid protein